MPYIKDAPPILKILKILHQILHHERVSLLLPPLPSTILSPFCQSYSAYQAIPAVRSLKQKMKVTTGYSRQLPRLPIDLSSHGKNSARVGEEATVDRKARAYWGLCKGTFPLAGMTSKDCLQ